VWWDAVGLWLPFIGLRDRESGIGGARAAVAFDGDDCGRGSGTGRKGGDGAGPVSGGKRRRQARFIAARGRRRRGCFNRRQG
jgi:hypothetical protein